MRVRFLQCVLTLMLASTAKAAPCEFTTIKQQIDIVLDTDAKLGAEFRAEFKDGSDPITLLEKMVPPQIREQIDICRFDVAEYLTRRGFPPSH